MKKYDVTIIGAGLSGLYLAKTLAAADIRVLLVDRKEDLSKGVHTTGIFVRKTFEDFAFPANTLGRPIRRVSLYSPSLKKIDLKSPRDEFRVGRMGLLYQTWLDECISSGVVFRRGVRFCGSTEDSSGSGSLVRLEKSGESEIIESTVLVGADGAQSRVANDLGLEANSEWIVGYEEVVSGVPFDGTPQLHCFLDDKIAPGYLAWITCDGEETHIGVGGYPSRFDPRAALKVFKQEIVPQIIETRKAEVIETRGGRIPVGGVLRRIANNRGLLIGDAAGAVSPLTAGGLDPCLRLSRFAGKIILKRLETGDAAVLKTYSGAMFRRKFSTRLLMRYLLKNARSRFLLETGFSILTLNHGKHVAERIFFKRASFPDVEGERLRIA